MEARITAAFVGLLGLIAARSALAVPALETGDILTQSGLAIRVLDGPLRPEPIVSGFPLQLSSPAYSDLDCSAGRLASDGDTTIVVDFLLDRFVSIDLATGAWQIVPADPDSDLSSIGSSSATKSAQRFAFEPGGSFVLANPEFEDLELIRVDPATGDASPLTTLVDSPDALAVASDGTILVFTSTAGSPSNPGSVLEVDPLSGTVVQRVSSTALGVAIAMAVEPSGDVLLGQSTLSPLGVLRVDPAGVISTLSGDGFGSGPAFDPIEALAVLADGDVVVLGQCPFASVLLRVDADTGDRSVLAGDAVGVGPELSLVPAIAVTPAGSILAIEARSNSILSVDAATGDREVAFDARVGDGPPPLPRRDRMLGGHSAIAIDRQHRIAWGNGKRILSVDPTTGERSVLSGDGVGSGDVLTPPVSMVFAPDGDLLVTLAPSYYDPMVSIAYCRPKVYRVDASTGDRAVASGTVGAGPPLQCPADLAMGADGYLYDLETNYNQRSDDKLMRIDVANGNRAIVSDATHGSGPLWSRLVSMTANATGSLYVADLDGSTTRLLRVETSTGARSILSGDGVGTGEPFGFVYAMAVSADGSILVNQSSETTVLRVDPVTGDRTPLSQEAADGLAVVPALVPEPGVESLALVALAALATRTRSCSKSAAARSRRITRT